MTDLAQHALQIVQWQQLQAGNPAASAYELQWLTPYLVGYTLPLAAGQWLSVRLAMLLGIGAAILLLPISMAVLLRRAGADPWLAVLGFPLAYGYSFYWGFSSFLIALPLGLLFLSEADRVRGGLATWSRLIVGSLILFFSHLVVWAVCGGVLAVRISSSRLAARDRLARLGSLAATVPLALWWSTRMAVDSEGLRGATEWGPWLARWKELPAYWVSADGGDLAALVWGLAVATGLAVLTRGGDRPRPARWLPLLVWGVAFGLAPRVVLGVFFAPSLVARLAVFGLVFLLLALPRPSSARPLWASRIWALAAALVWAGVLVWRFAGFSQEVESFRRVTQDVPAGARVLSLVPDATSEYVPGFPFMHFDAWLAVENGAEIALTFAEFPQMLVRKRERERLTRDPRLGWRDDLPERVEGYDLYLVRGERLALERRLIERVGPLRVRARAGRWRLLTPAPS